MKKHILILTAIFAIFFTGCNNFFHDLIPPDGNEITHFYIHEGQSEVEIGGDYINITVPKGTSLDSMIPAIEVSAGAELLPITREYIQRAFGDESTFGAAYMIYSGGDITEQAINLIQENKNFKRPVLDIPIDFNNPVEILVVSALGDVRIYKVNVFFDTGEGVFISFSFEKFYNPELVRTASGHIDESARTITVNVFYPVENIASYELIPVFQTNNARVFLNEREMTSALSSLEFSKPPTSNDLLNQPYKTQEKEFFLKRQGYDDTRWTLIVNFEEDPDTNRAIIDFRFTQPKNPRISADYMAEITVSDDKNTGTIEVTVYYGNIKPDELYPDFISPAVVTVDGVEQISGFQAHDFSSPMQYIATSRTGGYVRVYTVIVHLVQTTDPLPVISYFSFSKDLNTALASNSTAVIDNTAGVIMIEAAYSGNTPPTSLVPEFAATGNVTSGGVTQTSGVNANNFSGYVYYTVVNPSNPTLKRDYKVEVLFVQSLSSAAEITSFSFYQSTHSQFGLIADVSAVIDHGAGTITATLLFDYYNDITQGGPHILTPFWSAQGTVETGGVIISSGTDSRYFNDPVELKVVSLDGLIQMNYKVIIREVNSRIYVNENAAGRNNGTSWQNAYNNLPQACDDAGLFPAGTRCEVWIAKGRYKPSDRNNIDDFLLASPNTYYMGGFNGTETNEADRTDTANRRAVITGDLLGNGTLMSSNLFSRLSNNIRQTVNGSIVLENLEFRDAAASGTSNRTNGAAVNLRMGAEAALTISNCVFENLKSNSSGGAVYVYGSSQNNITAIANSYFRNIISSGYGGAVYANYLTGLNITDTDIEKTSGTEGGAVYASNIADVNITGGMIKEVFASSGNGGAINASYITYVNINGTTIEDTSANYTVTYGYDGITFTYNTGYGGAIYASTVTNMNITGVTIRKVSTGYYGAIYQSGGRLDITGANIENVSTVNVGGAIYKTGGILNITGTTIEDASARSGGAVSLSSVDTTISSTTIRNARAESSGGGIYAYNYSAGILRIYNSEFNACISYGSSGALSSSGSMEIRNTRFINCTAKNFNEIMSQSEKAEIYDSSFIHDNNLRTDLGAPNSFLEYGMFDFGNFYNCTFTNLRSSNSRDTYLFRTIFTSDDKNYSYSVQEGGSLTLQNCAFNFDGGSTGLLALYGGQKQSGSAQYIESNKLFMDGAKINYTGTRNLIWLMGNNDASAFKIKNITYNGTSIANNASGLNGLPSGIVKLENATIVYNW